MPSTITIEKLVYGGEGLAHLDGQVILAPFVLPGEHVSVEPVRAQKGLLRSSAPKVLESSEHRTTPRCEYFGACGGCHYQHADYAYQVAQKEQILRETLRRLGGLDYEAEIVTVAADPWFYRNRIQLHFSDRQAGFHKQGSHALCAVNHCYIAAPILVESIGRIQKAVRRNEWPNFLKSLELFTNGSQLQLNVLDASRPVALRFFEWSKTFLPDLAPGSLDYDAAGFQFRISGGSFFQVNRFLIEALVDEVLNSAEGEYAVDLYAGVGLFSLALSRHFSRIDAVERGLSAFRDLEFNMARNGVPITAERESAEEYLAGEGRVKPDLLIADPPRTGLGPALKEQLLRLMPRRLTIVSCDPTTLARDLRKLTGAYRIRRIAMLDLFPHTYHFETVVHLES